MTRVSVLFCYAILFVTSCIDSYKIPAIPSDAGYLVVEGYINSGGGPTNIQLSHTTSVDDTKDKPLKELKAKVYVESEDKTSVLLAESGAGLYTIDHLNIDKNNKYRIRIITAGLKEYVSDFVEVTQTPPIDNVTWEIDFENRGIQFYISTHDPENKARYYHWEYFETWQYHAPFTTTWEYINGRVIRNFTRENIYNCWITKKSENIVTTSSDKLTQDIIYRYPLVFIPANSEKLEIGYRILIKQYAVTRDAYDYLAELKKNSEQQGTLFDAQPSHLLGNIRCVTDDQEPVIGYVGAHGEDEKSMIIIPGGQLPGWFTGKAKYTQCPRFGVLSQADINRMLIQGVLLPADDSLNFDVPTYQPRICVDCREKGGTNKKPPYWPF